MNKIGTKVRELWLLLLVVLVSTVSLAQDWRHVGPKSSNQQQVGGVDNRFWTSQFNWIEQDPNDEEHFFAGGKYAGLWESFDAGENWSAINSTDTESGAIGTANFIDDQYLLAGTYFDTKKASGRVARYDFQNDQWTLFNALPHPPGTFANIHDVDVDPFNPDVYYVSTTRGLYRGVLNVSSVTWTKIINGCIQNMEIIKQTTTTAKYYVGGNTFETDKGVSSTGAGTLICKVSDDGITFTDVPLTLPSATGTYSLEHGYVGVAEATNRFYLAAFRRHTDGCFHLSMLGLEESGGTYSSFTNIPTQYSCGFVDFTPGRTAMTYIPGVDGVLFGSTFVNFFGHSGTPTWGGWTVTTTGWTNSSIHMDLHHFRLFNVGGVDYIYFACDGGLARAVAPTNSTDVSAMIFEYMNNGAHVCLVNGFSGAANNPDRYVIGGQDIIQTDFYDASQGLNYVTRSTWENDGGWFDRFDDSLVIFDQSSYNQTYNISEDAGHNVEQTTNLFFNPYPTPPFLADTLDTTNASMLGFTPYQYFQDPYRPGRIFHAKHRRGIMQLTKSTAGEYFFTRKVDLVQLTTTWGEWHPGWGEVMAMSFSYQTPNSMHFVAVPVKDVNQSVYSDPLIVQYIGDNLDNCWVGNNHSTTTGGQPQWKNIGIDLWDNLATMSGCSGCTNLDPPNTPTSNRYDVRPLLVETSPWNKDVIYVVIQVPGNGNDQIKVLKFDGSDWSNYSEGIPLDQIPVAMTMDRGSDDAIYLGTEQGKVYFRDANSSQWEEYLDHDFPRLKVRQMEINYRDNTVRAGLYGRGIWKSPLMCPTVNNPVQLNNPIPADVYEGIQVEANSNTLQSGAPTVFRGTQSVTWNPGFIASGQSTTNRYVLGFIHGCNTAGTSDGWRTHEGEIPVYGEIFGEQAAEKAVMEIFPNPNTGDFQIRVPNDTRVTEVIVTNIVGSKVPFELTANDGLIQLRLEQIQPGVHMVIVYCEDGSIHNGRVVVR